MKSNIFIPTKIKAGFQERSDTYTQLLAYVICFDGKKWRKEPSWNEWVMKYADEEKQSELIRKYNQYVSDGRFHRTTKLVNSFDEIPSYYRERYSNNPKVMPLELDNEPLEGFVLNKKAGDYKSGWNHRHAVCRVYDPRGFEFEISIENLLYILENANSIKGKGLEGRFVYGWAGKDLVLIPEDAPEYQDMVNFTEIQDLKITKKDLIPGYKYLTKNNEIITYLGEFVEYRHAYRPRRQELTSNRKKFWFYTDNPKYDRIQYRFTRQSGYQNVVRKLEPNDQFPFIMDTLSGLSIFSPIVKVELEPVTKDKLNEFLSINQGDTIVVQHGPDTFVGNMSAPIDDQYFSSVYKDFQSYINNQYQYQYKHMYVRDMIDPKFYLIKITLENGKQSYFK